MRNEWGMSEEEGEERAGCRKGRTRPATDGRSGEGRSRWDRSSRPGRDQLLEKPISSTPESYLEWMSLSTAAESLVPFTSSWKEAGMASVRLEAA